MFGWHPFLTHGVVLP